MKDMDRDMPLRYPEAMLDEGLYRSFMAGEVAAYDELMLRHGDSLTQYLNSYLHDWQDAEDLMIEAFARIMVKKPGIRDGGFKAYLYKTARNLAARFAAKQKRKDSFELEDRGEGECLTTAESRVLDREKRQALQLCLERIDPALREALWLVYVEDMSYAQAADVMGVNRKKIDNLLTRGKQFMRLELEKEGVTNAHE